MFDEELFECLYVGCLYVWVGDDEDIVFFFVEWVGYWY